MLLANVACVDVFDATLDVWGVLNESRKQPQFSYCLSSQSLSSVSTSRGFLLSRSEQN